jgi:hypothetical protein
VEPRAGFEPATHGLQEQRRQTATDNGNILSLIKYSHSLSSFDELDVNWASFPEVFLRLLQYTNIGRFKMPTDVDWDGFRRWLFSRFSYAHAVDVFLYARKFGHLLFSWKLSVVEGLPAKRHILMALANLSKFLGCYRQFKMMVEDSGVSWSSGSKSNNFFALLGGEDVNAAFDYYRRIMTADVDEDLKRLVRFLLLSGLRPCEGYLAVRFLNERREGYLDEGRLLLCHWKFPEFSRNGKRCFLTVLTKSMMDDLKKPWTISEWNHKKIRRRLHKVGLPVNLYLFRKCWATYMRLHGCEAEIVNLFQGRTPKTVFEQSYFRPLLDDAILKVRKVLEQMEAEILEC